MDHNLIDTSQMTREIPLFTIKSINDMKYHILFIALIFSFSTTLSAQDCFTPDASIWLNTWTSCQKSQNPKDAYGNTHWIQYNFGEIRTLSKSWVWNSNDPEKLDQGFNQVKIDYSTDGESWEYWGEMTFPKAEGEAIYGGFPGPDLVGIEAQFVLITVESTHGADCAGIAEIKFNLLPGFAEGADVVVDTEEAFPIPGEVAIQPNPSFGAFTLSFDSEDDFQVNYSIVSLTGKRIQNRVIQIQPGQNNIPLDLTEYPSGVYFLTAAGEGGEVIFSEKLVVSR